jgi:membrane protease YdiL (CAAX protease family)
MIQKRLYRKLYKSNIFVICLLGVSLPLLFSLSLTVLDTLLFNINGVEEYDGQTLSVNYIIMVIICAPLIETLLFQYAPLRLGHFFFKKNKYHYIVIILLSSLIFGALHRGFRIYPFIAFCYGIIWAFSCFLFIRKRQHPVLYTSVIHAFYNGMLISTKSLLSCFQIDL